MASFGVLSKKIQDFILPQTGLLRSTLGPLNLGPGGGSYNEPISCLQCMEGEVQCPLEGNSVKYFTYSLAHSYIN